MKPFRLRVAGTYGRPATGTGTEEDICGYEAIGSICAPARSTIARNGGTSEADGAWNGAAGGKTGFTGTTSTTLVRIIMAIMTAMTIMIIMITTIITGGIEILAQPGFHRRDPARRRPLRLP